MKPYRICVLPEHGGDLRPYGSAFIRLLRPLMHPSLSDFLEVTTGRDYEDQKVDAVVLDRLWRPDVSLILAEGLLERIRRAGARFIYALDDNFIDLPSRRLSPVSEVALPTEEHRQIVRLLLSQADGVIVTTPALKERFIPFNSRIQVVPNALDERLLVRPGLLPLDSPFGKRRKVIGYMGTFTHDDDLKMILPAWQAVWERHREEIEFQIVGVIGGTETMAALKELPIHFIRLQPEEIEYPLFMLWFTSRVHWDVAVSPLEDTPFTRCKSDIKFLDYAAIGAAGIYSRVPAYISTVRHRETGWLAENDVSAWVQALEELLANDTLRTQMARKASQYLYTERILAHCAHSWKQAIQVLLADTGQRMTTEEKGVQ